MITTFVRCDSAAPSVNTIRELSLDSIGWDSSILFDVSRCAALKSGVATNSSELPARTGALRMFLFQSDLTAVRSDIKTVDGKVDSLDHKMTVEYEATRGLINLGFENVQMLDEKMDRRFDKAEHANAGHRSVLEAAIAGLNRDMTLRRD